MAQAPLNPSGGNARVLSGKVRHEDAEWLDLFSHARGRRPATWYVAWWRLLAGHEEEVLNEAS